LVLDGVQDDDHDPRATGHCSVNEDELAEFLEDGRRTAGHGEATQPDTAARVRDLLADEAVWAEPATEGVDRLLAAVDAESRGRPAAGGPHPAAPPDGGTRTRARLMILSAAAALVVLAGVLGILVRAGGDDGNARDFAIAGTDLAPEASAIATVEETGSGVAIELDVSGLPPAEPGTYYQAWVKGPDGLVTVGTFHMRGGDDKVELWSGVPRDRYPTLTVTLQEEGGGQASSGRVVLSGPVG
jgi:Anti-sigma-K factor rskA, C-terminal